MSEHSYDLTTRITTRVGDVEQSVEITLLTTDQHALENLYDDTFDRYELTDLGRAAVTLEYPCSCGKHLLTEAQQGGSCPEEPAKFFDPGVSLEECPDCSSEACPGKEDGQACNGRGRWSDAGWEQSQFLRAWIAGGNVTAGEVVKELKHWLAYFGADLPAEGRGGRTVD